MGFAGELTTIGLGEVFQNVAFNRLTGVLRVMERDHHALVFTQAGRIRAFSHGDLKPFDYALIAERADAALPDDIRTANRRLRRRTLRAALAKFESFDAERFDAGVRQAIEEEVILLFNWKSASFTFEEGRPDSGAFDKEQLDCSIELDPQALAMEAARRMDEWEGISRQISSEREIFVAVQEPTEDLPEYAAAILMMLDGSRDLRTVLDELPDSRFQVMKTVAELVENGWAARTSAEHLRDLARKAQASGEVHRAARYLEAALDLEGGDLEAREDLARLYEKSGRKKEAAREHKRLAFAKEELGELDGALECYERSAVLIPFDTDTLDKIYQIHERRMATSEAVKTGRRLAEAFAAQSLHEEARDIYQKLVEHDRDNVSLREALAATHVKLHEPAKAAAELQVLARRAWSGHNYRDALHYYRSVLAVDRDSEEARERISEIESGRVRERKTRRRRRILLAFVTLLAALASWQGAREWTGQEALHNASVAAMSALAQTPADGSLLSAIERYAYVAADYPYTRTAWQAEETLRTLLLDQIQRIHIAGIVKPEYARKLIKRLDAVAFPAALQQDWAKMRTEALAQIAKHEREAR